MNYLDPNVNREKFKEDEIELVIRMHRLLGNRWSMIAGRIPGRTANDIKNYWNTHLKKTLKSQPKNEEPNPTKKHQVVRPLPRYPTGVIAAGGSSSFIVPENLQHEQQQPPPPPPLPLLPLPEQNDDSVIQNNDHTIWWNNTLKLLELEGDENMNQSAGITNAGTGIKGSETAMFDDNHFEWGDLLNMNSE